MEKPALATADVSDLAGGDVAMDARIRAVWRGARVVGPAFTVRTPPGEHPAVKRALEQAAPGDVIVIDGGAFVGRALWGDKLALRARELGVAGVVIDGAVRGFIDWRDEGSARCFRGHQPPIQPRSSPSGSRWGSSSSPRCSTSKSQPSCAWRTCCRNRAP